MSAPDVDDSASGADAARLTQRLRILVGASGVIAVAAAWWTALELPEFVLPRHYVMEHVRTSSQACALLLMLVLVAALLQGRAAARDLLAAFTPTLGVQLAGIATNLAAMATGMSAGIHVALSSGLMGLCLFLLVPAATRSCTRARTDETRSLLRVHPALAGIAIAAAAATLILGLLIGDIVVNAETSLLARVRWFLGPDFQTHDPAVYVPHLLINIARAPVSEEIECRGGAQSGLRARFGALAAIVISSTYFGLLHTSFVGGFLPAFVLGIALAVVREWTGSLAACMVLHALRNWAPLGFRLGLVMAGV